jgi:hypothetical protein
MPEVNNHATGEKSTNPVTLVDIGATQKVQ